MPLDGNGVRSGTGLSDQGRDGVDETLSPIIEGATWTLAENPSASIEKIAARSGVVSHSLPLFLLTRGDAPGALQERERKYGRGNPSCRSGAWS